jgi:hypothetical protein
MSHTDTTIRDRWLQDIAAIKLPHDLWVWAVRNAEELSVSPFRSEIKEAYLNRLKELETSHAT